jgi:hypothetical protein
MPVEKNEVRPHDAIDRFLADSKKLLNRRTGSAFLSRIEPSDDELCDGWCVPGCGLLARPYGPNSPSFLDFSHARP